MQVISIIDQKLSRAPNSVVVIPVTKSSNLKSSTSGSVMFSTIAVPVFKTDDTFERASTKPGTWNIPEHLGTFRNRANYHKINEKKQNRKKETTKSRTNKQTIKRQTFIA